jgi:hypothetical protein
VKINGHCLYCTAAGLVTLLSHSLLPIAPHIFMVVTAPRAIAGDVAAACPQTLKGTGLAAPHMLEYDMLDELYD